MQEQAAIVAGTLAEYATDPETPHADRCGQAEPLLRQLIAPTRLRGRLYLPERPAGGRHALASAAQCRADRGTAAARPLEPASRNGVGASMTASWACAPSPSWRPIPKPARTAASISEVTTALTGDDRQRRARGRSEQAGPVGGGADPALPGDLWRAAGLHRRRRHRRHPAPGALHPDRGLPGRLRRDAAVLALSGRHHRRAGAAAGGGGRPGALRRAAGATPFPAFPNATTRSAIWPTACRP